MMRGGFRKKKNAEGQDTPSVGDGVNASVASRLLELCGSDTNLYQSLARVLLVDPKRINVPLENFAAEARDYESKGDKLRAEFAYRIAGSVALYRGDAEAAKRSFEKALSVAVLARPEYKTVIEHPANAVDVARRFYESAPAR